MRLTWLNYSVLLKTNRLLAIAVALVLITGFTSPAFAAPSVTGTEVEMPSNTESVPTPLPLTDEDNVIFDNGRGDFITACGMTAGLIYCADDFVLDANEILTDVHFDGFDFLGPDVVPELRYFIHADDGGLPGAIIQSGDAVNEHKEVISTDVYRYWFDLDIPLLLNGGTTFWIAIDRVSDAGDPEWVISENPVFGNPVTFTDDDGLTWQTSLFLDMNFVLTGQPTVGGELLPIDTSALLLAGAQMNAAWMIPVIVSAIGIGLVIARKF